MKFLDGSAGGRRNFAGRSGFIRLMRPKLATVLLALTLLAPASAHAAGTLDHDFGHGGKTITDIPLGVPWSQAEVKVAEAPDGDLVAAVGSKVLTYTAAGELDQEFGERGIVKVAVPGSARFELGDVVVDREGRIDLIGTALTGASSSGRGRSEAAILRYLPDGRPDPTFGKDGIVTSTFGLRSRSLGGGAAVRASLAAVDGRGRITLALATAEEGPWCAGASQESLARGVVRLKPDGAVDSSFGVGGIAPVGPIGTVAALAPSPSGFSLAGPLPRSCRHGARTAVLALDHSGHRRRGFADRGVRLFTGKAASIAVDRRGRTVVLFKEGKDRVASSGRHFKIARLLPDGGLDPSFSGGWLYYNGVGPLYRWSSVVSEPGGALVLVGTLIKPLSPAKQRGAVRFHRWMVAEPLRPDGLQGNWFGWLGYVAINRFGFGADATATDALVDAEGDLIMAGTARRTGPAESSGLALARLELRH